jgi:hypothetical protein
MHLLFPFYKQSCLAAKIVHIVTQPLETAVKMFVVLVLALMVAAQCPTVNANCVCDPVQWPDQWTHQEAFCDAQYGKSTLNVYYDHVCKCVKCWYTILLKLTSEHVLHSYYMLRQQYVVSYHWTQDM